MSCLTFALNIGERGDTCESNNLLIQTLILEKKFNELLKIEVI